MSKNLEHVADIMSAYSTINPDNSDCIRFHYLLRLSETLSDLVNHLKGSNATYTVVYEYMGPKMHNWQSFHNGERIGWSLNADNAWYMCASHYLTRSE